MINEKLLISYLKKQKREYNEQVVILQKELTSSLMYNHKRDYLIKNLMYESIIHIIRIYENLIERIESGEFDVVEDPKKGGDNMSDRYNVINKEEPHGRSVAENGIPCTAKYCVAQLNRLFRDNEKLELKIVELESKLKVIEFENNELIDEKSLVEFIKTKKKEFEKEGFSNYKKHTKTLKNMESMEAVTATVDIYILMNLVRVLNELIEIIESGKFSVVEKSKKEG